MVDWRIVERLETDKCLVYQGKEEACYFRLGNNDGE